MNCQKLSDFALSNRKRAVLVFLGVFAFFSFSNSDGKWVLDDHYQVRENHYLDSAGHIPKILTSRLWEVTSAEIHGPHMYRPVFLISYFFDVQIFGKNPFWFHLHNNFLHAITTTLLFLLLLRFGIPSGLSVFASLVFGIHPLVVEAVTWIGGRMDLLAGVFSLILFHLLLSFIRFNRHRYLLLSVLLFPLGFFSKETFLPMPFLFLGAILAARKFQGRPIDRGPWKIGFGSLGVIAVGCFFWRKEVLQSSVVSLLDPVFFTNLWTLVRRFFTVLLVPTQSEFLLPYENVNFLGSRDLPPLILFGAALFLLLYHYRRYGAFLVGTVLFLGPFIPVSLVLDLTELLSERYFYLPLIGFSFLLAFFMDQSRFVVSAEIRKIGGSALLAIVVLFAFHTVLRNREWKDEKTLYSATIEKNPSNYRPHYSLAWVYLREGNKAAEVQQYVEVLKRNPDHLPSINNLAVRLVEQKAFSLARTLLHRALTINPKRAKTRFNLGFLSESQGHFAEAREHYRQALELDETYEAARKAIARLQQYRITRDN